MTARDRTIQDFLQAHGLSDWKRTPLAGDASMRRYERLLGPKGARAVLMDAPPDSNGSLSPYLDVTQILKGFAVSVPEVLHQDRGAGLLLLEDLGDDLFATVIDRTPEQELALYAAATDLLVYMHAFPCPELPLLQPKVLAGMTDLAFTEYRRGAVGDAADATRHRFEELFAEILHETLGGKMVFVHRDFHAQNLMWLPERVGPRRVGVIDFQDARGGHPAYDLVSLLQDARRDVPAEVEAQMIRRYLAATDLEEQAFCTAYAVLGVQRNMRILGIFARLARTAGKPQYLDLIPRVWAHFNRGLDHPALAPVADQLRATLPAPSPAVLHKLHP